MTRILSYNILYGGTGRLNELTKMIRATNPDIVGLVEASNPQVVKELANSLGMQFVLSGYAKHKRDLQVALLSRLPIVHSQAHVRRDIFTRSFLEVCVEEPGGRQLTIYVTHLTAAFNQLRGGDYIRRRQVKELLAVMAAKRGTPHLVMGDFNALAPGDHLKASTLVDYLLEMDRRYPGIPSTFTGHPNLNFVVPFYLHIFNPLLRIVPGSRLLSSLFDMAVSLYVPRKSIELILNAGYVDCFRRLHPQDQGFTCPSKAPAGRIDFIFASPELAARLETCAVITAGEGIPGDKASDHFPVYAEFS